MLSEPLNVLALFGAGAFAGVGTFFWLTGVMANRHDDEAGGCLGRALAMAHGVIAVGLLVFALAG